MVASWLAAPAAEARRSEALLLAATASMRLGEVARAGELAAEAAEGFRLRADQDGRLRALNLLGAVAFEQGALDDAVSRFEMARGAGAATGGYALRGACGQQPGVGGPPSG